MQVGTCARSIELARQAVSALSEACCFTKKKHNSRDDFKVFRGATPQRTKAEFEWGVSPRAQDDKESEPGSGDEDVLASLGASYRAWRAYNREKRAHEYTKTRLVELIKHETALSKQLVRVGGSMEGIERVLMKVEDMESAVATLDDKYDVAVSGQAAREDLALELEALQRRCQLHTERLHEAEAAASRWKSQCQQALPDLASSNLERERLTEELGKMKKTAVLLMNRQYFHLKTLGRASQLSRSIHHENEDAKMRSHSVEIV
ncbi:unnamed protein product [Phytophthora fragariaefolia]|uniref:Unnamed protein product n=1 Tax=Phytophthora fragariaefolia TaxID=1490495 RepID=A0A9W6TRW6_9STRA|nr:unnamed protein product [Phytophthora fragariaefolia]